MEMKAQTGGWEQRILRAATKATTASAWLMNRASLRSRDAKDFFESGVYLADSHLMR
jgi:hypothetical protein